MPKPLVYLISGLAADERLFRNLRLNAETRFLPWLKPLNPHEPFAAYCARMAAGIEPNRPALLVGVSFGGMVALQIAESRPWLRVAQISSINMREQMPWYFRVLATTGLHRLVPAGWLKFFPGPGAWFFGTKGPAEFALFSQILETADPAFLEWAIPQVLNWEPPKCNQCLQIIGTSDRIFPAQNQPNAILIKGGTHLMTFTQAAQISQLLNQEIAALPGQA